MEPSEIVITVGRLNDNISVLLWFTGISIFLTFVSLPVVSSQIVCLLKPFPLFSLFGCRDYLRSIRPGSLVEIRMISGGKDCMFLPVNEKSGTTYPVMTVVRSHITLVAMKVPRTMAKT